MRGAILKIMTIINVLAVTGLVMAMTRWVPPSDEHDEGVLQELYEVAKSGTANPSGMNAMVTTAVELAYRDNIRLHRTRRLFFISLSVLGLNSLAMVWAMRVEASQAMRPAPSARSHPLT